MTADGLLRQAEDYMEAGDVEKAEGILLDALKLHPDNKEIRNNLGVLAFMRGDSQAAKNHLRFALESDPAYEDALANFLDVLRNIDQLYHAEPYLKEALKTDPENENWRKLLDEIRSQAEEDARKQKTKSETESPESPDPVDLEAVTRIPAPRPDRSEGPLSDKRILHAPFEIAGNMGLITRYLRRNGVDAVSANYYDSWLKYACDINLNVNKQPPEQAKKMVELFASKAMKAFDIFHFHFAQSLFPDLRDLEELKALGKKILFSFWGSDANSVEWILYNQARFLGHEPPKPYVNSIEQYAAIRRINAYADVIYGTTSLPRGLYMAGFAETDHWNLEAKKQILDKKLLEKDPDKTYFVHAPTSDWKKGSRVILGLLEECKREGMPIEVLLVHGKTPAEARKRYAYADYAIDQIGGGTFGLYGVEMMCWEIPVLVYQSRLFDRIRKEPPVMNITKDTFKERILSCIEKKRNGEREEMGRSVRKWCLKNVDIGQALPIYLEHYEALAEGRTVPQEINPAWFRMEMDMHQGKKSEFYRYFKENGVFRELGFEITDYDKRLYE